MEENEVTPEVEVPEQPVTESTPTDEVAEQPTVEEPTPEVQEEPTIDATPEPEYVSGIDPYDEPSPSELVLQAIASQGGRAHLDGIHIEGLSEEDVERVVRDLVMNGKLNKDASGMVWGGGY